MANWAVQEQPYYTVERANASRAANQAYKINEQNLQQDQAINELANLAGSGDREALQKLAAVAPAQAKGVVDFQKFQQEQEQQAIIGASKIAETILNTRLDNKQTAYENGLKQFKKEYPNQDISHFPKTYSREVESELRQIMTRGQQLNREEEAKLKLQEAQASYYQQKARLAPRETSGTLPAALQLADEYQKARQSGNIQRMKDLDKFAKTMDKGIEITPEGGVSNVQGYTSAKQELEQAKSTGKKEGELETEKRFTYPNAKASKNAALAKTGNVIDKIDKVLPRVSALTSGFAGVPLSKINGTEANDVRATIDTIKANIGFAELQEMRDNSPTGGALGQVTEREIAFLQSVLANLETSQSPEQLRRNLIDTKRQIQESRNRIAAAFQEEYGKYEKPNQGRLSYQEGQTATNPSTGQKLIFRGGKWQNL